MNELVSVSVITYQHANWIGKALESILNQKTKFPYRIYVHDDASTDGTKDIVKFFAQKYPDRIVPFFEDENQYSKGRRITLEIMFPHMKGKYIASCEGDDYWISPYKLQDQIEYMESHKNCTFSFGNALIVDVNGNTLRNFLPRNTWNDITIKEKLLSENGSDFSMEEMILLDFIPTASIVYTRDTIEIIRDRFENSLDLLTRLVSTSRGYAHYHNRIFSAYRSGNSSSMSYYVNKSSENAKKYFLDLHGKILDDVDRYTNYSYHTVIQKEKDRKLMEFYINFGDLKNAKSMPCYYDLTLKSKIRLLLKSLPGPTYSTLQSIRERLSIIYNHLR